MATSAKTLDTKELESRVKEMYREVAEHPEREFHFETGRELAERQFVDGGGELWLCPICLSARDLTDAEKIANTKVVGATPMWEWGGTDTTVFSY